MSPILTLSLEVRQVHQEQDESSDPQGNNVVVMEMLRAMSQEMQERGNQLSPTTTQG